MSYNVFSLTSPEASSRPPGKTLQCISLMWTLLKQSPLPGKPTCEKVIVACPTSLVGNWANELVKWLGEGAINPLVVDGKGGKEALIPAVRRWVQAKGRAVTLPGELSFTGHRETQTDKQ